MIYFSGLIIVFSCIHIYDKYCGLSWLSYIAKPVATFLIFIYACFVSDYDLFSLLILFGLAWAFLGDIFLLSKKDICFTGGLFSFLMTHLFYSYAFYTQVTTYLWPALLVIAVYGVGYYFMLYKYLKKDVVAVAIYVCVIVIMVWMAVCLYMSYKSVISLYIMLGAFLFAFSDSVLAWDKFKKPLKHEPALVMISYYLSQYMIVVAAMFFFNM